MSSGQILLLESLHPDAEARVPFVVKQTEGVEGPFIAASDYMKSLPDLVGREGQAITDLRPSGTALIGDERIDVVSESEWITEGTPVRVVSAEGYRHVVRPVAKADPMDAEA